MPSVVKVVTPPAVEPVSLQEAKDQLRVTFDADDVLIGRLITVARRVCETLGRITVVNTQFDLVEDSFPVSGGFLDRQSRQFYGQFSGLGGGFYPGLFSAHATAITLPRAPLVSVESVKYLDTNGTLQTLSSAVYQALTGAPGRVAVVSGQSWPVTLPQPGALTIRFTAGYGPDATTAPETVKQAVLIYLTDLYENRGEVLVGNHVAPSRVVSQLLACEDNSGGYS